MPTLFSSVFKIKKLLSGCFIEFSLEYCFKVISHDYDIRNIQQPYISDIIAAVYLTVIQKNMKYYLDTELKCEKNSQRFLSKSNWIVSQGHHLQVKQHL